MFAPTSLYSPYMPPAHSQSRFDADGPIFRDDPVSETIMSDILYLAIGLGAFVVLALYAGSLGRI